MGNGDRLWYVSHDFNGRRLKEVGDAVEETDAVNRRYVDAAVAGGGGAAYLADLADVDVTQYPPSEGYSLRWMPEAGRANGGRWVAAPQAAGVAVDDLTDVDTAGAVDGQVLALSGDTWVPVTPSTEVDWAHVPAPLTLEADATNSAGTSPLRLNWHDTATGRLAFQAVAVVGGSALKGLFIRAVDDAGKPSTTGLSVWSDEVRVTGGGLHGEVRSSTTTYGEGSTVTTITKKDGVRFGIGKDGDTALTRASAGVLAVDDRPVLTAVFSATEPVAPAVGAIWIKTQEGA